MRQLNADLRVIGLMNQYGCSFIPKEIMKYFIKFDPEWPEKVFTSTLIQCETLLKGLAKAPMNLKIMKYDRRRSKKTLLQYLQKFQQEGAILLEDIPGDKDSKIVGFDPVMFGPLFPTYEQALKVVRGENV